MSKHSSAFSLCTSWVKFILRLALSIARLLYRCLVFAVEAFFWCLHGLSSLFGFGKQAVRSARALATGVVRCPDGHEIPITAGDTVHACTSCGFRYRGSPLLCPSSECEAPVASYVSCPTCSLSVSSPFRGH